MTSAPCPCDTTLPYAQCCSPLHAGEPARDAAALMRSRYSAYVLGLMDYLRATWHSETRPDVLEPTVGIKWLRLKVLEYRPVDSTHAEVEFVARFIDRGRRGELRERSRFVHEEGRWFYVDGDIT